MKANYYFSEFEPIAVSVNQVMDFSHLVMGFIS